jgi:hypothetical protein
VKLQGRVLIVKKRVGMEAEERGGMVGWWVPPWFPFLRRCGNLMRFPFSHILKLYTCNTLSRGITIICKRWDHAHPNFRMWQTERVTGVQHVTPYVAT